MLLSNIKINLRQVMKSNTSQTAHRSEKVDSYFYEYARSLFLSKTNDLYMQKADVLSLLRPYGFKGKINSDSLSFMAFIDLLREEKMDKAMLKSDE
jgi:hypothetical protein